MIAFPLEDGTFETSPTGHKLWECQYCQRKGSSKELDDVDCSYSYEPCPTCKEHPYCARDCELIAAALTGDGVYLAGFERT
jgi:hypothetical protein